MDFDKEKIKMIIELSSNVEEADDVIRDIGYTDTKSKMNFLQEMFGTTFVGRYDADNVGEDEAEEMDYYALLNVIVKNKWGA